MDSYMGGIVTSVGSTDKNPINRRAVEQDLKKCESKIKTLIAKHGSSQHPLVTSEKNRLCSMLFNLEKYDEAAKLQQENCNNFEKAFGRDHPTTLSLRGNLATLLERQGKLKDAEGLYKEVLEKQVSILGRDHDDAYATKKNLLDFFKRQKRYDDVIALDKDMLDTLLRIYGPHHDITLRKQNNISYSMNLNGQYDEAFKLCSSVLDKTKQMFGSTHGSTIKTEFQMAAILENLDGKLKQSSELFEKVYKYNVETFGENDRETLFSRYLWACVQEKQGKRDEAIVVYKTVLKKYIAMLGKEHPLTEMVRQGLLKSEQALKDHK